MEVQQNLPFPTMNLNNQRYKIFGIVTNMDWNGEELIHWYISDAARVKKHTP